MSYTQSPNNRHNKSTQNGNRGTSIVVKNFPKNQTTFKHIKPEPQSYSEAVKSAKTKNIVFEASANLLEMFPICQTKSTKSPVVPTLDEDKPDIAIAHLGMMFRSSCLQMFHRCYIGVL